MKRAGAPLALIVAGPLCLGSTSARAAEEIRPAFQGLEPGSSAIETFRLNSFELVSHEVSAWPPTLVFGGKWWRVTRGKFRNATSYDDFFRTVGRSDLADQYSRRRILSTSLIWGGLAAEVAGAVLFFTGLYEGGFQTRAKVGLAVFSGGFVASAIGGSIQHPAVSEEDALGMVSDYNRRLHLHLGLTADSTGDATRTPRLVARLRGRW